MNNTQLRNKYFKQYVRKTLEKQGFTPRGNTQMIRYVETGFLEVVEMAKGRGEPWISLGCRIYSVLVKNGVGIYVELGTLRYPIWRKVLETPYYKDYLKGTRILKKELDTKPIGFAWPCDEERIEESFQEVQSILENELLKELKKWDRLDTAIDELERARKEDEQRYEEQGDREIIEGFYENMEEEYLGSLEWEIEVALSEEEQMAHKDFFDYMGGYGAIEFSANPVRFFSWNPKEYHRWDLNLAVLYYRNGDLDQALNRYQTAIRHAQLADRWERNMDFEDDEAACNVQNAEEVWKLLRDENAYQKYMEEVKEHFLETYY